ncbi:unnamed protein product [Mytilus coruscus]|uniref:Uncharacterized protein n=1 Tax=Mytilus coruscus TaxID=42192 RepID=A0A6J8AA05_MYTCO|nr:unnamed protein product [Mytilus coruscus]
MICLLCQKQSSVGVWSDIGCKTIRLDKIKEHEHCSEHLASVNRESEQENADKCNQKLNQNSRRAFKDVKVIYYSVVHNLSLDLFSSLVDLNIELGSCNLNNLKLAKNAKYTSWDIVSELLKLLNDEVRENLFNEMRKSPTYSLMVDEVMDITSHKHLAICARYIDPECNIKNAFICDPLIDDGRAETIIDKIKEELQSAKLPLSKMPAFGSDGAAVLSGRKMVYGQNPSLITNHCKDHRLALACRDSYKNAKVVKRLDDTLYNLHKYYKYSCNHTKSLENVQKALGEPVLKVKRQNITDG